MPPGGRIGHIVYQRRVKGKPARLVDVAFGQILVVLFAGVFEDFPIRPEREDTRVFPRFHICLRVFNRDFVGDVLVVGAGPVGLTMACELARHGVRCRIVDRLAEPLPYCRAIGVTPRTLEVWDDMGIAREMIDAGIWIEGLRSMKPNN